MTKWGKIAASSIAILALAGCSAAVSTEQTVTVTAAAPSSALPSTASAGGAKITGDITTDVLAAGYDPDNMNSSIDWLEGWMCDASHEEIIGDSEFDRHVRTTGSEKDGDVGADALRVIVHYKCPDLSQALEASIADAQEGFWD